MRMTKKMMDNRCGGGTFEDEHQSSASEDPRSTKL